MPRVKGKVNYKKEVLLQVVREVLPSGALGWEEVSRIYQERSSEGERRNGEDVKRHWQEKCCNRFMKPTGAAGDKNDFIYRAQEVHREIMKNNQMSIMSTDNSSDEEDNNEEVNAQKVGSDEEEWIPADDGGIEGDDRGIDTGAGGDDDAGAGGEDVGTEGDALKAVAAAACASYAEAVACSTASASSNNNKWISKRGMNMLDKMHVSDEPLDVDPVTPKYTKIVSNKTKNSSSSSSNKQRANIGKSLERLCDSLTESSKAIFAPSASESQAVMMQMMQQQMSQQTAMMQFMMNSFTGKKRRKKHKKKKHHKKRSKKSKSERVEVVKECDGGESKNEESDSSSSSEESSSSSSSSGD